MNGQITWIDNILYNVTLFGNKTNEVLSHAAWVNLGKIMWSERSQSQTLHIVRFHLLQTQSVPRESSGDKVGSRVAWDEGFWGRELWGECERAWNVFGVMKVLLLRAARLCEHTGNSNRTRWVGKLCGMGNPSKSGCYFEKETNEPQANVSSKN